MSISNVQYFVTIILLLTLSKDSMGEKAATVRDPVGPADEPVKPSETPLLLVTRPLMKISYYYCAKVLPKYDWTASCLVIDNLIKADIYTHNSSGTYELSDALAKCGNYFRGESNWTTLSEESDETDDEPIEEPEPNIVTKFLSKALHETTRFVNSVPFYASRNLNIGRATRVNPDVVKIVRLLHKIAIRACQPKTLFEIREKYFKKLQGFIDLAVNVELDEDDDMSHLSLREALEEYLSSPRGELWEISEELVKQEQREKDEEE